MDNFLMDNIKLSTLQTMFNNFQPFTFNHTMGCELQIFDQYLSGARLSLFCPKGRQKEFRLSMAVIGHFIFW